MDQGMGVVARLLVRNGTLRVGDILLAGRGFGRVRQMLDDHGRALDVAGPSTPVSVAGLDEIPEAGDRFYVVPALDDARSVALDRRLRDRTDDLAAVPQRTMESLLAKIEEGKSTQLSLIIKADVQGSIEAITGSIAKFGVTEVRVNILHTAVGGVTTGDVALAEASDALIIGFNVVPDASARQMADAKGVDIRLYRIIYEILEDIRKALEEGLAPEIRMETTGRADVRQVFKVSKVGTVAGCIVTDGVVNRNSKLRVIRNGVVIGDERTLDSLKRFKDDAREVKAGMECGLKIAGFDDVKEGDSLEFYQRIEVTRKL
jgi:translation initiation factor IF-2